MEKDNRFIIEIKIIISVVLLYGISPFAFAYGFVEFTNSSSKPLEIAYLIVFWLIVGRIIERISHND